MTPNQDKHQRRSIRLKDYDYSQAGAYFITICTYNKKCMFGKVLDQEMQLNEYGKVVTEEWLRGDLPVAQGRGHLAPTEGTNVLIYRCNHGRFQIRCNQTRK